MTQPYLDLYIEGNVLRTRAPTRHTAVYHALVNVEVSVRGEKFQRLVFWLDTFRPLSSIEKNSAVRQKLITNAEILQQQKQGQHVPVKALYIRFPGLPDWKFKTLFAFRDTQAVEEHPVSGLALASICPSFDIRFVPDPSRVPNGFFRLTLRADHKGLPFP